MKRAAQPVAADHVDLVIDPIDTIDMSQYLLQKLLEVERGYATSNDQSFAARLNAD
jgi:hypothetical protein